MTQYESTPQIFRVGGCVRDILLGTQPKDFDYMVVGATHQWMIDHGFQHIHASSFPVYLMNGEEYALARTEKKIAPGYNGFECMFDTNVTLKEDLSRRDLTCNSLAVKIENWDRFIDTWDPSLVIDYFGGIADIRRGILQHINENFALDPIRVLRAARFAARYGWEIANVTRRLMEKIAPELNAVPQERIWAEFEKGLMEQYPDRMFKELIRCHALYHVDILKPYRGGDFGALEHVKPEHNLITRFLLICYGFIDEDYERCRIPTDCIVAAKAFRRLFKDLGEYCDFDAFKRLQILESVRALNDPTLLMTCLSGLAFYKSAGISSIRTQAQQDIAHAKSVDAAAIATTCKNGLEIRRKITDARLQAMQSIPVNINYG